MDKHHQKRDRKKSLLSLKPANRSPGFTAVRSIQITCSALHWGNGEEISRVCSQDLKLDLGIASAPSRAQSFYPVGKGHGCWEARPLLTLKQENNITCQLKCHLLVTPFSFILGYQHSFFWALSGFACWYISNYITAVSVAYLISIFLIRQYGQRPNPTSFLQGNPVLSGGSLSVS